ncbi:hypothetical protein [Tateyamaria sp.]|uniref:hypothetical protein n=1 Tax=Tateyamaria sp. TaxID=1929288 RepID=UPI00329AAE54
MAERFAKDFGILIRLYGTDAVFTEICSDYLSLCAMNPSNDTERKQVSETLEGLEAEIATQLDVARTPEVLSAEHVSNNKVKRE